MINKFTEWIGQALYEDALEFVNTGIKKADVAYQRLAESKEVKKQKNDKITEKIRKMNQKKDQNNREIENIGKQQKQLSNLMTNLEKLKSPPTP